VLHGYRFPRRPANQTPAPVVKITPRSIDSPDHTPPNTNPPTPPGAARRSFCAAVRLSQASFVTSNRGWAAQIHGLRIPTAACLAASRFRGGVAVVSDLTYHASDAHSASFFRTPVIFSCTCWRLIPGWPWGGELLRRRPRSGYHLVFACFWLFGRGPSYLWRGGNGLHYTSLDYMSINRLSCPSRFDWYQLVFTFYKALLRRILN
jgi:hypothetical protein